MSIEIQIREPVWDCLPEVIAWLKTQRDIAPPSLSQNVRAGINFSIILNTACYVEGALEHGLMALLRHKRDVFARVEIADFQTRRALNLLFNRLNDELERRIARTTGAENYDVMFEILTGMRFSTFSRVAKLWEGLRVLFHLRNVVAHGRAVSARLLSGPDAGIWTEEFDGGYRRAEEYLLKNSLIDGKFVRAESDGVGCSERLFFADRVADHFWSLAQEFIDSLLSSFSAEEQAALAAALRAQSVPPSSS